MVSGSRLWGVTCRGRNGAHRVFLSDFSRAAIAGAAAIGAGNAIPEERAYDL
jgi:hypothetical protein